MSCPLCQSEIVSEFHKDKHRTYFRCSVCDLVYVPAKYYLTEKDERERYELHNNSYSDSGYVASLEKLLLPLLPRLEPAAKGLDFGSGPQPIFSRLLIDKGFDMDIFDPFYANNTQVFDEKYDFITATEVVEHLYKPNFELFRLFAMLTNNGVLGILTQLRSDTCDFKKWWYKNDKTHVCFFSRNSFFWIAKSLNAHVKFVDENVILLSKQALVD
jgi:hypothetical protein